MKTDTTYSRLPVILFPLLMGIFIGSTLAAAIEVGEPAPDFILEGTNGKDISLSEFKGKSNVLIEFYSFDFNPVCTKGLTTRGSGHKKFKELGVQVLGISGENTFSQKMFAASLKLPYPLLSDFPDFEVIRRYGLLKHIGESKQAVAQASYLLIDKEGIVRQKWIKPKGEVFPNDVLLDAARELAGL